MFPLGEGLPLGVSIYSCAALRGGHGDVTWGSQRGVVAIVWTPITGAAFHQFAAAQDDKQSDRHHEVNGEAGQEDDDLIERQTGALDNLGRDATVDADRGETTGLRAVNH